MYPWPINCNLHAKRKVCCAGATILITPYSWSVFNPCTKLHKGTSTATKINTEIFLVFAKYFGFRVISVLEYFFAFGNTPQNMEQKK